MLSTAQVDTILGPGAVSFSDWAVTHAPDLNRAGAERTAGGLECRWSGSHEMSESRQGMLRSIGVLALPASATADTYTTELRHARCDPQYDVSVCRLGRTIGSVWVMARTESPEPPQQELSAALDAVEANLPAFDAPVAMADRTGWWLVDNCADLGEQMKLSDLLGPAYHTGRWEGSPQYEDWILEAAGVRQFCQWSSDATAIPDGHDHYILSVTLEPGGAWQWGEIAPQNADAVSVRGAKEAVRKPSGSADWPVRSVWATDGVNVVTITAEGGDVDVDVAERVLAARGAD